MHILHELDEAHQNCFYCVFLISEGAKEGAEKLGNVQSINCLLHEPSCFSSASRCLSLNQNTFSYNFKHAPKNMLKLLIKYQKLSLEGVWISKDGGTKIHCKCRSCKKCAICTKSPK
jgi:hypothetical protein